MFCLMILTKYLMADVRYNIFNGNLPRSPITELLVALFNPLVLLKFK